MKKLFRNLSVLLLTAVAVLATGCYEQDVPFLTVDHEVVLVSPATDKGTVVVESNVEWTASSDCEWIAVDNGFGNHKGTFEFFVEANTTPYERSGKIKLEGAGCAVTILVRQQSEGTLLTLAADEIAFTKLAGEYQMSICCNNAWTAASSADWCKVDPTSGKGNGSFKISVDENATGSDRMATISVVTEADGKTQVSKVNVFQSASNDAMVVSPESKQLTEAAEDFVIDLVTVGSWSASVDSDWLTLGQTNGKGDAKVVVSASANETGAVRNAVITFATGKENENRVIRQVFVSQEAFDFYLELPVADFPLSLYAQDIEIPYNLAGSNVTVSASSNVDWMKVTSVADGKAVVAVNENKTSKAREGIIAFVTNGQNGNPIIRQARVAQAPTINLLDVLASEYAIEWVGDVVLIPIYSNTPVSARSSESWCHVAVKNQDVVISVDRNETALPREAVVTVRTESESGDILSKTTIIRQAAAYSELVVSPATKMIFALEETFVGSIVTNNSWTASVDSPWLTIDKTEGTGDYKLTIKAEGNTTGQERVATITVETGIENSTRESATIVVTQVPEQFYFEIPGRDYALTKLGQDLQIPYQTSGNELDITAATSDKWIHINGIDPATGMINLTVEENTTEFVRKGVVSVSCTPQYGDPKVIDVTITQSPTVNILDIFVDNVDVAAKGDTLSLPFYANVPVQVTSSETWVHVGQFQYQVCCDGQQVATIKVDPNRTAEARTAFVTITNITTTGEKLTRVITVRQAALQASLAVTPKTVIKPSFASEFDIKILSTGTWSVTCDESWITLSDAYGFADGSIHVSMPVNESGADRTATITIATGAENEERVIEKVTVTQLMKDTYLIIPEEAYALNLYEQPLKVGYYVAGELTDMQVNCSEDWITYDSANSDATSLAFKVKENVTKDARTATVTVTATFLQGDPITDSFIVTQAPTVNILDVFVSKKSVSGKGETFTLPYYCNTNANATSSVEWMTVALDDANDPQAIEVVVDVNRTAETRKGYITVTNINEKGEKLTKVIEVEQAPLQATLMVTPEFKVLPAHNASFVAGVNCTGKWAVNCEVEWLTLSATSGEGDTEINVVAADNETGAERVATITVTTDAENGVRVTKDIVVKQIPFDLYLEIPEDAYALNKYEQTLEVAYVKAGSISDFFVEESEDWITFTSEDGANLTFNVQENTTAEVRTATVTATVVPVKGEPITDTFTVTQAPTVNILDIFQDYIAVLAEGEQVVLPLLTNTTIDAVVSNAAWVSAVTANDRVTIDAAENTTGLDRKATVTVTTTTDKGQTLKKVITVFQPAEGMYFDIITPLSFMVSKEEQTVPVKVYAATGADNNEVKAESDSEWLVMAGVTPEPKVCNIDYTVAENTTDQIRVGNVVVTYTDQKGETHKAIITVTQAPTINTLDAFADYMVVLPEGETETVAIMTNDAAVSVVSSDAWVSATATTSLVTITADENETGVDRQARITISTTNTKGNMVKKVVTVFQPAEKAYFRLLTEKAFNLTKEEQVIDAVVYAATGTNNGEIDQNTDVAWINFSALDVQPNTCKISYTVSENTTGQARTGHVNVVFTDQKGETFVETVTVNQAATVNTLDALADYIAVAAEGETNIVPIQTNTTVSAAASEAWLTVNADPNGVTIVADENETGLDREATVTVTTTNTKGDVVKKVITVFQPAEETYFDLLSAKTYYVNKEGQTIKTVAYAATGAASGEINADPDCSWITLASVNAADNLCTVEFTVAENTTAAERTGKVVFTYTDQKGATHTETVTYVQAPTVNTLDVLDDYMVVVPEGETEKIAVITNDAAISTLASDTWVSAVATNNEVTITADENTTGVDRQASVTVSTTNTKGNVVKKVITVFQPAEKAYITLLTSNAFNLTKEEQKIDAVVYSATGTNNGEIDQNTDVEWITLSGVTPAANACKITYTVSENTTGNTRTGHINVIYTDQKGEPVVETITVNQAATVNVLDALEDYIIVAAAGETNIVPIQTNTTVSAAASEKWLTVNADANGVTIVADENTTGAGRQASVTVSTTNTKGNVVKKVITVFQPAEKAYITLLTSNAFNLTKEEQEVDAVIYSATGTNNGEIDQNTDVEWITQSGIAPTANACKITYTVNENTTGNTRTGHINVIYTDQKGEPVVETITVNQAATVNVLDALEDYITVAAAGETNIVPIQTNTTVAAVTSEDWLHATADANGVLIIAGENASGLDREATVTVSTTNVKGDVVKKVITVFQPAKNQFFELVTADNYTLGNAEGTVEVIAYVANGAKATNVNIKSNSPWITVGAVTASGKNATATATVQANNTTEARNGQIDVTYTDEKGEAHKKVVTLVQAATEITFESITDYITLNHAGETYDMVVVSDAVVKALSSNTAWLTAAVTPGTGVSTIKITATPNTTGEDRTGHVTVYTTIAGKQFQQVITVFQPAADTYFDLLTAKTYYISKEGQTVETVAYASTGADAGQIKADPDCSWINPASVNAVDKLCTVKFTVSANNTAEERTGHVVITYTDEKGKVYTETVTYVQAATVNTLDVLSDYIVVAAKGESQNFAIVANGTVTVTENASWFTANEANGVVTVAADRNTTGVDRQAVITVETANVNGNKVRKEVVVFQPAEKSLYGLLTPAEYFIGKEGATIAVEAYASTGQASAFSENRSAAWIPAPVLGAYTETHFPVTYAIPANNDSAERTGVINIIFKDQKGEEHVMPVTVHQAGTVNTLDVLDDAIVVAAKGEVQNFAIVSNGTVTVTENANWFTANVVNGVVTVVADENTTGYAREAAIVVETANVNGNKVRKSVTVYQPAKEQFFELVTADNYTIGNVGDVQSIVAYVANGATATNVQIKSNTPWISIGTVTASGNTATATALFDANTTAEVRSGQIDVTYTDEKGAAHKKVITVNQATTEMSFESLTDYITLSPAGEAYDMVVVSSETITAVPSAAWLKAVVTPGTGVSTIKITAVKNDTGYDRTGAVTVYATVAGKQFQQVVTVFQPAAETYFDLLTAKTYYVAKEGQTIETVVYASTGADAGQIKADPDCTWITPASVNAADKICKLKFTVGANNTAEDRTGHVVITYTDEKGKVYSETVTYVQAATVNTLDALSDYIVVAAKGESQNFAIVSNGAVTVTENATWFTATESNGVITVAADPNATGYSREAAIVVETANVNGNKVKKQVTVYQPAADFFYGLISPDKYLLNETEQNINVTVYASANIASVAYNEDASWIAFDSSADNANTKSFTFKVSANTGSAARAAVINMTYTDAKGAVHTMPVSVSQSAEATAFDATPEYLTFAPKGEDYVLVVESSNDLQQAIPSANWISAVVDGKKVKVTATENTTGADRTGRVTVVTTIAGKQYQKVINVAQPAKSTQFMLVSASSVALTNAAANFSVAVYSLGFEPVTASTEAAWLTVPAAGTVSGNVYTFACSAEANKSAAERTAEITLYGTNAAGKTVSATVTVAQSPTENVLDIYTNKLTMLKEAKTILLPIYASFNSPVVKSNEAWLTASLYVEDGVQFVKLAAGDNTSATERVAIVTIKCEVAPGNVQTKTITVIQQGTTDDPNSIKLGTMTSVPGSWM